MCLNKISVAVYKRPSPHLDRLDEFYGYVPCGKCPECVTQRKSQWCWRAIVQNEHSLNSLFLTLTYNDQSLPIYGVDSRHITAFFKRVRSNIKYWYPEYDSKKYPLKYFLVSEYGTKNHRPHYHAIVWNCPLTSEQLERTWKQGFVYIGDTLNGSVQYTLKYFATKGKEPVGMRKNFCQMSKGIGKQWLADNLSYVKSYVRMFNGEVSYKIPLPRVFREALNKYDIDNGLTPRFPKNYDFFSRPSHRFSTKFLKSKAFRATFVDNMSPEQYNILVEKSDEYCLYRSREFFRKYDKLSNDNQ